MARTRQIAARFLVVVLCGLLTAAVSGAAPATAQSPELTGALLRLDDLPGGWRVAPDDLSGEGDGGGNAFTDPCDENAPAVQPLGMAVAEFEAGGEESGAFLYHAVVRFAPEETARAMAYLRAELSDCGGTRPVPEELRRVFAPLAITPLGDESFAYEVSAMFEESRFQVAQVVVRRGDAITFFLTGRFGAEGIDRAEIERLAGAIDQRLVEIGG